MQNHVHFEDGYFKKTILEYQDWKMAFFRETAQNSVDASSKNVKYTIIEENDKVVVIIEDDGSGMTESILSNKFLVMGGSHKENAQSVGGFGYAKSIILFCHENYEIHTQDNYMNGSYGRYSNVSKIENRIGTKIRVEIDPEIASSRELSRRLTDWVKESHLKGVNFYLNDVMLTQDENKFEYKKDISIGELKFNDDVKDSYYSSICIRMRGMSMFKREIYGNTNTYFHGVIELNFESSINCLTSNRDGLIKRHDLELNKIIQNLTTERSSYKSENLNEFIINKKIFKTENREILKCESENNTNFKELENESVLKTNADGTKYRVNSLIGDLFTSEGKTIERDCSNIDNETKKNNHITNSPFEKLKKENKTFVEKVSDSLSKISSFQYPTDFLIQFDSLKGKSQKEVIKKYKETIAELNKKRSVTLSNSWDESIRKILNCLYETDLFGIKFENGTFTHYGRTIKTGFIYSTNETCYGQMLEKEEEKNIYILLNVTKFREDNLNSGDFKYIMVHEVAHIFENYHNDNHAAIMFKIDKIIRDKKLLK